MAVSEPRYALSKRELLSRRDRVWAIFSVNFRQRVGRAFPVTLVVIGMILTIVPFLITVLTYQTLGRGSSLTLDVFYGPYGNFLLLLFIMLLTALVGGGIVADDLGSKSISLYLSRPITLPDYLVAKGAVVAATLSLIAVLPGILGAILAFVLGYVDGTVALEAFGAYLAMGILFMATFATLALFLSSLTEKRAWAASGIFALLLMDDVVADVLHGVSQNVVWLYVSPWEDLTCVARALFQVMSTGDSPNPYVAFSILLVLIVGLASATFVRLSRMELVTE